MTTPSRPPLPRPRASRDEGHCEMCGSVFPRATVGRPRVYCSDPCRIAHYHIRKLEDLIEEIQEDAPVAGKAAIRSNFWRLANRVVVNKGKPNEWFLKKRGKTSRARIEEDACESG